MDNNILSALKAIDVATLSRADWIAVGMALKEEGYPCSIWDDWSRNDKRYHPGECERKWNSFHGSGTPVKGGTIVQMAKERGWTPFGGEDGCLNWDDAIEYDGADGFNGFTAPDSWSPSADLITYLELLFDADDRVGYVTNDVWQDAEGKWLPSKGVYDRTAGELIASLKKHPDDLGATIGDWKPQVGAWIRFNPLDGDGVKNENITKFRFALVESDTLPVAEQDIVFRKLELPIAALVHSGGKSLHAIVRVDAENYDEYRKRVEFLYDFLEKNGVSIDKQNRNPSRLSRMPGVTRNGNRQYLVATNIGRKSWVDWMDFVEGVSDELPDMVSLDTFKDNPPELPEELMLTQGLAGGIDDSAKVAIDAAQDLNKGIMDVMDGLADDMKTAVPSNFNLDADATVRSAVNGATVVSGGSSYGALVSVGQMIVRSEDDIRRISQELYDLIQTGSRAQGRFSTA